MTLDGALDLGKERLVRGHLDLHGRVHRTLNLLNRREDCGILVDSRCLAQSDIEFEDVAPHQGRGVLGALGQVGEVRAIGGVVVFLVVPVLALFDDVGREPVRPITRFGHWLQGDQAVHDQSHVIGRQGKARR